jgi:hypothetical protein
MYYYPSLGWVTQYLFGRRLGGPERNSKFEVRSSTSAACCVPDDCFFFTICSQRAFYIQTWDAVQGKLRLLVDRAVVAVVASSMSHYCTTCCALIPFRDPVWALPTTPLFRPVRGPSTRRAYKRPWNE